MLNYITNENLEKHVTNTVREYTQMLLGMDLKKFNSNLIDPIKMMFDSKVTNKNMEDIIKLEITRQKDKTNSNIIGYFHQNIFKYFENSSWIVPEKGYDIINESEKIFVEMKNKHNTMNSSSSQRTYLKMQSTILSDSEATCYLVEIIAKQSQNIIWSPSLDGVKHSNEKIRRISIDKFYELVTGEKDSFFELCKILPSFIDKAIITVLNEMKDKNESVVDTVIDELKMDFSKDLQDALFLLAFPTYSGFKK